MPKLKQLLADAEVIVTAMLKCTNNIDRANYYDALIDMSEQYEKTANAYNKVSHKPTNPFLFRINILIPYEQA